MQIRYEVMFVAIGLSEVLVQSRPRSAYYFTLEVLLLFRAMAKKDFTQVAHAVFMQATGGPPVKTAKQLAGRKGGLKGGKTRMAAASDAEKARLSAMGVTARKMAPAGEAGAVVKK